VVRALACRNTRTNAWPGFRASSEISGTVYRIPTQSADRELRLGKLSLEFSMPG